MLFSIFQFFLALWSFVLNCNIFIKTAQNFKQQYCLYSYKNKVKSLAQSHTRLIKIKTDIQQHTYRQTNNVKMSENGNRIKSK